MIAPDSSQLVIFLLIAAVALSSVTSIWAYSHRQRTSPEDSPARIIRVAPTREVSERLALWDKLSNREREIAALAAAYWSDDEIARELHLSVRTVQNHLQHARGKLRIHSRHELKYFIQQLGDKSRAPPR